MYKFASKGIIRNAIRKVVGLPPLPSAADHFASNTYKLLKQNPLAKIQGTKPLSTSKKYTKYMKLRATTLQQKLDDLHFKI